MSVNGITGTVATVGTDRALTPVVPVSPLRDSTTPQPRQHVQSTKEMKIAELKGQQFSIGEEQLIVAIEKANKALQGSYTSFEFSIHEGTKEIMVKVMDRDTGEVIREIPSEKILDLVAKMWELTGVFVDERR